MDDNEPTHFNVLVAGTGLAESVLAAALSKSGYSVLQLDSASYYGTEHASLSLTEFDEWLKQRSELSPSRLETSTPLDPDLVRVSQRFALSLYPCLLRASGPGIDLLVRSRVATYLQFGLLGGVGLCQPSESGTPRVKVERVPASKADVFNNQTLSLVEKRRLTKLLLFAAGNDPLEEDKVLSAHPDIAFREYLKTASNLSGTVADSLNYALALCSSPDDPALPALRRLRSIIHSVGRYGPSPYLVGHYGGAGDLVGGFSRICAVWGGGQILGRPLAPLDLSPPAGEPVPASQPPFMVHENPPPPPSNPVDAQESTRPLGIPVQLEEGKDATLFTGDWVVTSPHLLSTLLPSPQKVDPSQTPSTVNALAILREAVPFPPRPSSATSSDDEETPASSSDSNLFVFPASSLDERIGTVTALQLGKGTMSCPDGYHVLYLTAPLVSGRTDTLDAPATHLSSYLDSLLALLPDGATSPVYSAFYFLPTPPTLSSSTSLPANLLVTPSLPSQSKTEGIVTALDEVVEVAESMFWQIVGDEGKKEGVEFFRKDVDTSGDGDEDS